MGNDDWGRWSNRWGWCLRLKKCFWASIHDMTPRHSIHPGYEKRIGFEHRVTLKSYVLSPFLPLSSDTLGPHSQTHPYIIASWLYKLVGILFSSQFSCQLVICSITSNI
jgi:hypothetical protein